MSWEQVAYEWENAADKWREAAKACQKAMYVCLAGGLFIGFVVGWTCRELLL